MYQYCVQGSLRFLVSHMPPVTLQKLNPKTYPKNLPKNRQG